MHHSGKTVVLKYKFNRNNNSANEQVFRGDDLRVSEGKSLSLEIIIHLRSWSAECIRILKKKKKKISFTTTLTQDWEDPSPLIRSPLVFRNGKEM